MTPVPLGTTSAFTVSMRRKKSLSAMPNAARISRKTIEPRRFKIRSGSVNCLIRSGIGGGSGRFDLLHLLGRRRADDHLSLTIIFSFFLEFGNEVAHREHDIRRRVPKIAIQL